MRMILNKRFVGSPRWSVLLVAVAVALVATACSPEEEGEQIGVSVVATTTILGDMARNIVGDAGVVEVLLPIGADPHASQPSSSQIAAIYKADLVIANGLGLEEGFEDVLRAALGDGVYVLEVGELVSPVSIEERGPCLIEGALRCDPHIWLDPERDAEVAILIGDGLALVDDSSEWEERAAGYAEEIRRSSLAIAEMFEALPEEDRVIVTNHGALGYFADRYGFEIIGTVIPGISTLSDPSSGELADLVALINETGVSAIFAETTGPTVLADAIASEADHDVEVVHLYTGSLGEEGSGAETLIGMLETNASLIVDGLSSS